MENKSKETTASISIHEFARLCKEVDRELEEEFAGVFAQKRIYEKAAAYADALADPAVAVKSCWDIAEHAGHGTPGQFQSLRIVMRALPLVPRSLRRRQAASAAARLRSEAPHAAAGPRSVHSEIPERETPT